MKLFIAVIIAATVIGGFVGAELMDSSFSITGAVVGGVGLAAILLWPGAFFDAHERKRKEKELPPEMRAIFDRMLGKNTSFKTAAAQVCSKATNATHSVTCEKLS